MMHVQLGPDPADTLLPNLPSAFVQVGLQASFTATVETVADGDTLAVRSRNRRLRVRLLGVDAPELNYMGRSQGAWAVAATRQLQLLCPRGAAVRLAFDRERTDRYGRLLAYVSRGDSLANLVMVRSGWAIPYQIYPNLALLRPLQAAAVEAAARGLGIHDPRNPLPLLPYEFRWSVDHRQPDKFCGDAASRRYVSPADYRRVPAIRRVFFPTEADARAAGYGPAAGVAEPAVEPTVAGHPGTLSPVRDSLELWGAP